MIEQVMIYEIKSSAASNAMELFSNDNNYFYWNDSKFKNLKIGDFVFVVNRTNKWVLFCVLDKIDIDTKENNNNTIFYDNNKTFDVSGKYNKFIRLKINVYSNYDYDWKWQSLGSSENTYLNGRVGLESSENRLKNISQLKELFQDKESLDILNQCNNNFIGHTSIPYNKNDMNQILTAIKTKPFVLLAGISGTGKSRLVRTLAYKTCIKEELRIDAKKPGNFELIPVSPNWHDSSELIGYVSRINGEKYIVTDFLKFIAKAWKNLDVPFFLCLDEMNLAPVEQYFAEFLSIIETRQVVENNIVTDYIISKLSFENSKIYQELLIELELDNNPKFSEGISIPNNLVVIGTVNMDETTHSFSKKVLDRAMTLEMNDVDLNTGLDISKNDWSYSETYKIDEVIGDFTSGAEVFGLYKESKKVISYLTKVNEILEGSPFKIAYRVRDEFLIYCYYASLIQNKNWLDNALDEMTFMKILSRIEGDEMKTSIIIEKLLQELNGSYPISVKKLNEMKNKLQYGYTSFWS